MEKTVSVRWLVEREAVGAEEELARASQRLAGSDIRLQSSFAMSCPFMSEFVCIKDSCVNTATNWAKIDAIS